MHVDVKKLGRLRDGGGWRAHGRDSWQQRRTRTEQLVGRRVGYDYIHCAVDDHTRIAYAEIHPTRRSTPARSSCAAAFFARHGITVERAMTDNAIAYRRGRARFTRPYRPQTNGKAERFNRTLLDEWAYQRPYTSNQDRADALPEWLHTYNYHRSHTSLGGQPPISRVNNGAGHYT